MKLQCIFHEVDLAKALALHLHGGKKKGLEIFNGKHYPLRKKKKKNESERGMSRPSQEFGQRRERKKDEERTDRLKVKRSRQNDRCNLM